VWEYTAVVLRFGLVNTVFDGYHRLSRWYSRVGTLKMWYRALWYCFGTSYRRLRSKQVCAHVTSFAANM
jgi:hypothetical protein